MAAEEQAVWALSAAIVANVPPGVQAHYRHVAPRGGGPRVPASRASVSASRKGPTSAQLENRAHLRKALGLSAGASLSQIRAAVRGGGAPKDDRAVLEAIAALVGAPSDAKPIDVYLAMQSRFSGEAQADAAKQAAMRELSDKIGALLFDAVGASREAIFEEFRKRFKVETAPTAAARRAPSQQRASSSAPVRMTGSDRRRMAIDVGREAFGMTSASEAEVEMTLYMRRPEIMPERTFATKFGPITLTRRELAKAASMASQRDHKGAAFERLVTDYAENKAGSERASGARKG